MRKCEGFSTLLCIEKSVWADSGRASILCETQALAFALKPRDREHTPRSTYSAVPLLIAPADADLPPFCAAVAIKSPGAVAIRCSREPRPLRPLNGEKGRP